MPNFNGQGSPSFAQGPKGLADMLASALRGGVKATLGMPGDIERMGRMGINALGGSVDPQSALPTTEDWGKRLPPVNPMTDQNFDQVEKLGEFLPINLAGPAMGAVRKANSAVQALRQSAPSATNMGRRTALKGIGAAGASAAVAPELVVQALRNTPATPIEGAAKAAARIATPDEAIRALGSGGGRIHASFDDLFSEIFTPQELGRLASNPQDLSWLSQAQRDDLYMTPINFSKAQREQLGIPHRQRID